MTQTLDEAIADLVTANHILHGQGILDAFGHVSARHPERPDHFLLSRNLAPSLVQAADILTLDLDGSPVGPDAPRCYLERFIHAAIYSARPDVGAVVHSHSRSVLPFGVTAEEILRPVSHMAGFLGGGAPVFEIRSLLGNGSDLLVRDLTVGHALAETLADTNVVLMRGHGATAVGRDVRQAVFHAVYTEMNAQVQAQSLAIGTPTYLTVEEARAAAATNDGQIPRAWDYWCRQTGDRPRE